MKCHFAKAMLAWTSLALATLAGCGSGVSGDMDHMSPRSVVVAMHQAVVGKDYDRVGLCVAPAYRAPMRSSAGGMEGVFHQDAPNVGAGGAADRRCARPAVAG